MPGPVELAQPTALDRLLEALSALRPYAAPAAAALAPLAAPAAAAIGTGALVAPAAYTLVNPEMRQQVGETIGEVASGLQDVARRYTPWGSYVFGESQPSEPQLGRLTYSYGPGVTFVSPPLEVPAAGAVPLSLPSPPLEVPIDMPTRQAPTRPLNVPADVPPRMRSTPEARQRTQRIQARGRTYGAEPYVAPQPYMTAPAEEVSPAVRAEPYVTAPVQEVAPALRRTPVEVPVPERPRSTSSARKRVQRVNLATRSYGAEPYVAPQPYVTAPPAEVEPALRTPPLSVPMPERAVSPETARTARAAAQPAATRPRYGAEPYTAPQPYITAPAAEVAPALRTWPTEPYVTAPPAEPAPALRAEPYVTAPVPEIAPALRTMPLEVPLPESRTTDRERATVQAHPLPQEARYGAEPSVAPQPYITAPPTEVPPALRAEPYTMAPVAEVQPVIRTLPLEVPLPERQTLSRHRVTTSAETAVSPEARYGAEPYTAPQPYVTAPPSEVAPVLRAEPYITAPPIEAEPAIRETPYVTAPVPEVAPALREMPYTVAPVAEPMPALRREPLAVELPVRTRQATQEARQRVAAVTRPSAYGAEPYVAPQPYITAPVPEVAPVLRTMPLEVPLPERAMAPTRTGTATQAQPLAPEARYGAEPYVVPQPYVTSPVTEVLPALRAQPYISAPPSEVAPAIRETPYITAPVEEVAPALRAYPKPQPYVMAPVAETMPAIRTTIPEATTMPSGPWPEWQEPVYKPAGKQYKAPPKAPETAPAKEPKPETRAAQTREEEKVPEEDWRKVTSAVLGEELGSDEMNAWIRQFRAEHDDLSPWEVGPGDPANNFIDHLLALGESRQAQQAGVAVTPEWWEQAHSERYGLAPGEVRPISAPYQLALQRLQNQ